MINFDNVNLFCNEDITLIENYEKAINDKNEVWICHHKLGIELKKTVKELIKLNLYFNRPANEFIFLTRSEHFKIHNIRENIPDSRYKKMCESLKKKFNSEYYHNLFSNNTKGEKNPMYGHIWTEEEREHARQGALKRDNTNIGKYERTEEINNKMSKSLKGKLAGEKNPMYGIRGKDNPNYGLHWYNDGVNSIKARECPEGFKPGRICILKK